MKTITFMYGKKVHAWTRRVGPNKTLCGLTRHQGSVKGHDQVSCLNCLRVSAKGGQQ